MGKQLTDCSSVCPDAEWHCGHLATNSWPCQFSVTQPLWRLVATRGTGGSPHSARGLGQAATAALSAGAGGRRVAWPRGELCHAGLQEPEKPGVCAGAGGVHGEHTGSAGGADTPRTQGGPASGAQAVAPTLKQPGLCPPGRFLPPREARALPALVR